MRTHSCVMFHLLLPVVCVNAGAVTFQMAGPVDGGANDSVADLNVRVATDGLGHWVAVYEALDVNFGFDTDIWATTSTNNGATWSTPVPVNDNYTATGDDDDPEIATDGNGNWVCIWYGPGDQAGEYGIYTSKSIDNGATWSARVPLTTSVSASITNQSPHIASDGVGQWIAVWASTFQFGGLANPNDYDIVQATSSDGAAWSAMSRLNSEAATDDDADGDGNPFIASDGNGTWVCVWESYNDRNIPGQGDKEILFARSANNGVTWSAQSVPNAQFDTETGLQESARVACDGSGNWIMVWEGYLTLADRYDVNACASTNDGVSWGNTAVLSANSSSSDEVEPDITTDRAGKWLVVWQRSIFQGNSQDYDIAQCESLNNGAAWSAVTDVNSNAVGDSAADNRPSAATDGNGHWVVLWGVSHFEADIWRAISGAPGPAGTLSVLVPNGGEKWRIGRKRKVEWTSSGTTGSKVRLELWRDGGFVQVMKGNTNNDGKQRWLIPNTLPTGNGYQVRIVSKTDATISDTSDGVFRIKPPQ